MKKSFFEMIFVLLISISFPFSCFSQGSVNERIVHFAEGFLGTDYDPDPLGAYVRKKVIVYDEKVDCVYLVFRSVELALANNESNSIEIALDKRFKTRGIMSNGLVLNYDDRYEYMEDVIPTGKLGKDITHSLSERIAHTSSPRVSDFDFIPKEEINKVAKKLKDGDIVYFVKGVKDRKENEIVGHLGIVKIERGEVFLIHASGIKVNDYTRVKSTGRVVKVPLCKYVLKSRFLGIKVTRM